jgi:hypothetical protein
MECFFELQKKANAIQLRCDWIENCKTEQPRTFIHVENKAAILQTF